MFLATLQMPWSSSNTLRYIHVSYEGGALSLWGSCILPLNTAFAPLHGVMEHFINKWTHEKYVHWEISNDSIFKLFLTKEVLNNVKSSFRILGVQFRICLKVQNIYNIQRFCWKWQTRSLSYGSFFYKANFFLFSFELLF